MRVWQGDRRGRPERLPFLLLQEHAPGVDDPPVQVLVPALALREKVRDAPRGGQEPRVAARDGVLYLAEQCALGPQPLLDVLPRAVQPPRNRRCPLPLDHPQVPSGLLDQAVQFIGEADRQQPGPLGGGDRGVEGVALQLAFQHELRGDLLVLHVEVEPADQRVDRVGGGAQYVLVPCCVVALLEQRERYLPALMAALRAGVVAGEVLELRVVRLPVQQEVDYEPCHVRVFLGRPVRGGQDREPG